jgi:hypothetical protein
VGLDSVRAGETGLVLLVLEDEEGTTELVEGQLTHGRHVQVQITWKCSLIYFYLILNLLIEFKEVLQQREIFRIGNVFEIENVTRRIALFKKETRNNQVETIGQEQEHCMRAEQDKEAWRKRRGEKRKQ